MENEKILKEVEERSAHEKSGWGMLAVVILCFVAAIAVFAVGAAGVESNGAFIALIAGGRKTARAKRNKTGRAAL